MTDREKVNVRGLALEVLLEVTEQKEYSHLALRGGERLALSPMVSMK